jgi:hypothetical protein
MSKQSRRTSEERIAARVARADVADSARRKARRLPVKDGRGTLAQEAARRGGWATLLHEIGLLR